MSSRPDPPHASVTDALVAEALREDLGAAGDLTTNGLVPEAARASAKLVARRDGRLAGLFMARRVFERLDPELEIEELARDGEDVATSQPLARLSGKARTILTGERTALNFVGHLSGIATLTRDYVAAVSHTKAEIVATRKTTPGLRALEKYAVVAGGGAPHRYGLFDMVLIKDNHIAVAGGIKEAVARVREYHGRDSLVPIQVEVDDLRQLEALLPLGVDSVLLDNMDAPTLREAVAMCQGTLVTEASGGVSLESVRSIAETGVDRISIGALTHSAPALDVALDIEIGGAAAE